MRTKNLWPAFGSVLVAGIILLMGVAPVSATGEIEVPLIKTTTADYQNVRVFKRTATHLSFAHENGTAVIKLSDIDAESLASLERALAGLPEPTETSAPATPTATKEQPQAGGAAGWLKSFSGQFKATTLPEGITMKMVWYGLGVLGFLYLAYCYCCSLICAKAGRAGGFLVWVPVLQMIPMFRAAGMSGWWFLAMFVPLLNLVGQVLWCVKITQARGKGFFTAVMLILPVTNLLAFLYLAFSNGHAKSDENFTPVRVPHALAVS